jgi:hypothetical protein
MKKEIINSEIIVTLLSSEVQRSRRPWGKIFLSYENNEINMKKIYI